MSATPDDSYDRFPTTGPNAGEYTRFTHIASDEGMIIYDERDEGGWIQAEESLDLDAWR